MAKITYYTSALQKDDSCSSGFSGRITTKTICGIDGTSTENKNNIEPVTTDLPTTDVYTAELVAIQTALEHAVEMGATAGTKLSLWADNKKVVDWIHGDMFDQEYDLDNVQKDIIQTIRSLLNRLGRKKNWAIVQHRTNDNSLSKAVQQALGFKEPEPVDPLKVLEQARKKHG